MATRPDELYEEDFYAWTRHQARELRRLRALRLNTSLDLAHLAEVDLLVTVMGYVAHLDAMFLRYISTVHIADVLGMRYRA